MVAEYEIDKLKKYDEILFLFYFLAALLACRILVPQPGIKPMSPAVITQSLNQWITREVQ